jgi:hypothetical protein
MERRPQGLKRVCGNPGEEPQVPPLRSPGFPVESLDQLHAALSTESCTRGRCWPREVGNPGELRSESVTLLIFRALGST